MLDLWWSRFLWLREFYLYLCFLRWCTGPWLDYFYGIMALHLQILAIRLKILVIRLKLQLKLFLGKPCVFL